MIETSFFPQILKGYKNRISFWDGGSEEMLYPHHQNKLLLYPKLPLPKTKVKPITTEMKPTITSDQLSIETILANYKALFEFILTQDRLTKGYKTNLVTIFLEVFNSTGDSEKIENTLNLLARHLVAIYNKKPL